ncbi:MAG: hypothetical protein A2571_01510 [Candidatus Vogelbacteria bacterium RIFOXYD1_FULL_44_32]|uniref:Uncharacterized protein n=1 Tax=Candidatus Vogelbacteria bacterium RIFOXYD1_FULL_44_32 TaxID=1802438 RepID=A0A1G2QDC4_9BACT|nr:MAG: hypothetical protein A2571_01510 [Candidatus Vogelbacteria bacterium RIFOXYD1_FULL_44_32]
MPTSYGKLLQTIRYYVLVLKQIIFKFAFSKWISKKNILGKIRVFGVVVIILANIFTPLTASAAINQQINYQGKLTTTAGAAVTDATRSTVFSLYTASSGGTAIWTETQSVSTTDGLFSVMLGSVTSLATVNFNQTLYLGVNVASDGEMSPRKIIGAVPASFYSSDSDKLDGLTASDFLYATTTNATATITSLNVGNSTTTNATTTSLYVGSTATVAGSLVVSGTATSTFNGGINLLGTNATLTIGNNLAENNYLKFNYSSTGGGDVTGQLEGVDQMSYGFNNRAYYGGTAGVASGRTLYILDRVAGLNRGGFNASGDFYVGPSTTNYGLNVKGPNSGVTGLTVLGNGYVGIGTSTPDTDLAVFASTGTTTLKIHNSGTDLNAVLQFMEDTVGQGMELLYDANGNDLTIRGITEQTPIFTAERTGRVGIGKANPSTTLDIVGTASSTGLQVNGSGTIAGSLTLGTALGVASGGTGLTSYTLGDVIYASGTGTLAGTSTANLKTTLSLNNVENTALSTWAGTTNLTTLGTIATGLWHGTAIEDAYITKTGAWTGTFDGQEGSYYLDATNLTNFGTPFYTYFSATTTDALTQGSTNKYYADSLVNAYIHASSTIPKTYTANTFTGANTFNSTFTIGSFTGPLQAANGVVSATTSIGVVYGGTGLTSAPAYGNLLVGNASSGYTLTATSSLNLAISDTVGTLSVAKGGTGATTFGQGWIYSDGGTGALAASTSPTVNYITATSTIATSTFAGGLAVETSGLVYDYSTNKVGIGTDSPTNELHVNGNARIGELGFIANWPVVWFNAYYDDTDARAEFTTSDSAFALYHDQTNDLFKILYNAVGTAGNQVSSSNVALSVNTSGNVGIGSTTPEAKLTVQNTGTGNSFIVEDQADDTSPFVINASGNVGIGMTAPGYSLEVSNAIVSSLANGSGHPYIGIRSSGASMWYLSDNDTTNDFHLGTSLNDTKFVVDFSTGNVGIGDSTPDYTLDVTGNARFTSLVDAANFVATSTTATSTFAGGLAVETSGLVYDYSTNFVGIGTASPSQELEVISSASNSNVFVVSDSAGTDTSIFRIFEVSGGGGLASLYSASDAEAIRLSATGDSWINTDNDLGIGTTSPLARLDVVGSLSGTTPLFQVSSLGASYATTTRMIIDSSGNVGIGSSAPSELLTIQGASGGISGVTADTVRVMIHDTSNGGTWDIVNPFASFAFSRADTSGEGAGIAAEIGAVHNVSSTGGNVRIGFFTAPTTSGTMLERMSIMDAGEVGIGTTTPSAKLTVTSDTASDTFASLYLGAIETASDTYLTGLFKSGTTNGAPDVRIVDKDTSQARAALQIQGNNGSTEIAFFGAGGNVGIGTTTPQNILTVNSAYNVSNDSLDVRINNTTDSYNRGAGILFSDAYLTTGRIMGMRSRGASLAADPLYGSMFLDYRSNFHLFNNLAGTTEFMRITSAGNMGIGTTTPLARLDVVGSLSGTTPLFQVSSLGASYATSTKFIIDSSGNVGIGTTTPGTSLGVAGAGVFGANVTASVFNATSTTATSTFAGGLAVETSGLVYDYSTNFVGIGTANPHGALEVDGSIYTSRENRGIFFNNFFNGTNYTTINNGESGVLNFGSSGELNYSTAASRSAGATGSQTNIFTVLNTGNFGIGTSTPGTQLGVAGAGVFGTYVNASIFNATSTTATSTFAGGLAVETNGLVYDYSTNFVGVGTAAPQTKFNVNTASASLSWNGMFRNTTHQSAVGPGVGVKFQLGGADTPSELQKWAGIAGVSEVGTYEQTVALAFYTRLEASAADATEKMRITGSGNVGVGTTTPLAQLTASSTSKIGLIIDQRGTSDIAQFQDAGTSIFVIKDGGNVGIGTTTPGSLLSIGNTGTGPINLSATATSTFGFGINLRGGCFSINDSCLASGGSGTPVGSNGNIQFNNSGSFGGENDLNWNSTLDILQVATSTGGQIHVGYINNSNITGTAAANTYISSGHSFLSNGTNAATIYLAVGGADTSIGVGQGGDGGVVNMVQGGSSSDTNGADGTVNIGLSTGNKNATVNVYGTINTMFRNTATTNGVCHSGTDLDTTDTTNTYSLVACSAAPGDIAEFYPVSDEDIEAGDIVAPSLDEFLYSAEGSDPYTGVVKSLGTQDVSIMDKATKETGFVGVVSTGPFQTFGKDILKARGKDKSRAIALVGRVPVKVNGEGGNIKPGDRITISSEPGIGMKATTTGMTLGVALNSFAGESVSDTGEVMVFINMSYAKISDSVSDGDITEALWQIDNTTGDIKALASLDLGGKSLKNISSLSSITGKWSISEDGKLVVDEIETNKLTVKNGITTQDKTTGDFYCIYIDNGTLETEQGRCEDLVVEVVAEPEPEPEPPAGDSGTGGETGDGDGDGDAGGDIGGEENSSGTTEEGGSTSGSAGEESTGDEEATTGGETGGGTDPGASESDVGTSESGEPSVESGGDSQTGDSSGGETTSGV